MTTNNQKINKVIESLEKVKLETKQLIFNMSGSMTEEEIIQSFNQQAFDLFNLLQRITEKFGKRKESELMVTNYFLKMQQKLIIDYHLINLHLLF